MDVNICGKSMIERFHLGAELEPRIHRILEKGFHRSPDLRKTIPFLSDLLNSQGSF
jgi:hypothetical protein